MNRNEYNNNNNNNYNHNSIGNKNDNIPVNYDNNVQIIKSGKLLDAVSAAASNSIEDGLGPVVVPLSSKSKSKLFFDL